MINFSSCIAAACRNAEVAIVEKFGGVIFVWTISGVARSQFMLALRVNLPSILPVLWQNAGEAVIPFNKPYYSFDETGTTPDPTSEPSVKPCRFSTGMNENPTIVVDKIAGSELAKQFKVASGLLCARCQSEVRGRNGDNRAHTENLQMRVCS